MKTDTWDWGYIYKFEIIIIIIIYQACRLHNQVKALQQYFARFGYSDISNPGQTSSRS